MVKKWLDILKIPGIVVGCIVTILTVIKAIESIPEKVEESNKALIEGMNTTVKIYADSTNAHFQRIENMLDDHADKLDKMAKSVKTLNTSHVELLKSTGKIDLLLKYYEDNQIELKKNESYLNEIQLEQSPLWIPYSFK